MQTAQLIASLEEHQTGILANMRRAEAVIACPEAFDMAQVARLRWELLRLLSGYQMFKHRQIFDVLIHAGSFEQRPVAARMKADCEALGEEVKRFITQRSAAGAGETVEVYRADVRRFITRLREHLSYERAAAIALLTPVDGVHVAIPPRAASSHRPDRPTPIG